MKLTGMVSNFYEVKVVHNITPRMSEKSETSQNETWAIPFDQSHWIHFTVIPPIHFLSHVLFGLICCHN